MGIQPLGSLTPKASVGVFGDVESLDVAASPIHNLENVTLDNSGKRIVVDPITRIEGHLRIEVNVD